MNVKKMIGSFRPAFIGLKTLFKEENNAKFHLLATFLVLCFGFFLEVSKREWAVLFICIGGVISAEIFNTAIELLCNKVEPKIDQDIKKIKDLSAAAVLVMALVSFIVALLIFIPKLNLLSGLPTD